MIDDLARPDWGRPRMAMEPRPEPRPARAVLLRLKSEETGEEWELGGLLTPHAYLAGSGDEVSRPVEELLNGDGTFIAVGLKVVSAHPSGTLLVALDTADLSEAPSGEGTTVRQPEKTQETVCDEHKAQYFYSGYDAGKRDGLITLQEFND